MSAYGWLKGKRAALDRTGELGEIVEVEEIQEAGEVHQRITVELEDGREFNTDADRVEVQPDHG